jgi:hypothetical protein
MTMMKRAAIVLAVVLALAGMSRAEVQGRMGGQQGSSSEQKTPDMMKCPPTGPAGGIMVPQIQGTDICQPATQQSMGPRMLQEIMRIMLDMMEIQEKTLKDANSAEKKAMLKDLAQMKEKMERLTAACGEMTTPQW